MNQDKEKRTERKTLPLTPSEFSAFQAAADWAGLPLSTWMVQALRTAVDQRLNEITENEIIEFENATREAIAAGGGCPACGDITGFECIC